MSNFVFENSKYKLTAYDTAMASRPILNLSESSA